MMRAKAVIENTESGRERIIVTEIPFQTNKAEMIKKTVDLINDKKLEGISDIRDESDRDGIRIVYELKRDANTNVVLNKLYQYTALQTSFSVNNIALVKLYCSLSYSYVINLELQRDRFKRYFMSSRIRSFLRGRKTPKLSGSGNSRNLKN